jgi:hypothetical protein
MAAPLHQRPRRPGPHLAGRANIGVGCLASGIVGLDLDRHDGGPNGIAVFAALCRVYGQPWPDTLTVATPHAGLHCTSASRPASRPPARSAGGQASTSARPATGGYLADSGSVVDGAKYVIDRDVPAVPLPAG